MDPQRRGDRRGRVSFVSALFLHTRRHHRAGEADTNHMSEVSSRRTAPPNAEVVAQFLGSERHPAGWPGVQNTPAAVIQGALCSLSAGGCRSKPGGRTA
jgi:hypothetical protein